MNAQASATTIVRLIAIKREELDRARQDLQRLEHLVETAEGELQAADRNEHEHLEGMRRAEQQKRALDPMEMIERRRYQIHLQGIREKTQVVYEQAVEQRNQAQRSLERIFSEIRTLERLAERRQARIVAERQRKEYLLADDQEITRNCNRRTVRA